MGVLRLGRLGQFIPTKDGTIRHELRVDGEHVTCDERPLRVVLEEGLQHYAMAFAELLMTDGPVGIVARQQARKPETAE